MSRETAARRIRGAGHCQRQQTGARHKAVNINIQDVLKTDAVEQSANQLAGCLENRNDWEGSSEDDLVVAVTVRDRWIQMATKEKGSSQCWAPHSKQFNPPS